MIHGDYRRLEGMLLFSLIRDFLFFTFLLTTDLFSFYRSRSSRDRLRCPWQQWHWRDGCAAGQRKVIYFRWPTRSSGLKASRLIWLLLCLFFPPPAESTLLLQLLQTEKVMGLRFCPDKGVRTLSLLLTPLSHQWDQEGKGTGGGGWGPVSHSLPPSSCLKLSAAELPLASLYLIPTSGGGSMGSVVWRHIHHFNCLIKCEQGNAEAPVFLDQVVGGKRLRVVFVKPGGTDCQRRNRTALWEAIIWLREQETFCNPAVTLWGKKNKNVCGWRSVHAERRG